MTNEEKIKKWLSGELSEDERREFEGTGEFARINKLLEAVQHFKAPPYDVQGEYNSLSGKLKLRGRTISLVDRIRPVFKIAAILVVALAAGYFLYQQVFPTAGSDQWITGRTEIYLPDSSFVSLNKASSIRFSREDWAEERNVELKGEAFFSVSKGLPFTVQTQQGEVTVLGTEFNVKDREDYFQVTCYSGSVKVATTLQTVVLQPKSAYRLINGSNENYIFSGASEPDWFQGESRFNSVPIKLVFDELERQYDVVVETKNVDVNQLFTGSFSHKNLEIALKAITIPVNLHYEIDENKSVITVEGK